MEASLNSFKNLVRSWLLIFLDHLNGKMLDYDEAFGSKVPEQPKVPSHESVFQFILMLLDEFKVIDVVDVKLYNSYVNSVLNDISSVVRKLLAKHACTFFT